MQQEQKRVNDITHRFIRNFMITKRNPFKTESQALEQMPTKHSKTPIHILEQYSPKKKTFFDSHSKTERRKNEEQNDDSSRLGTLRRSQRLKMKN